MALARVVTFEGVTPEQAERVAGEIRSSGPPDDVPATELIMLHDPAAERATVVIFFDDEEGYERGDRVLSAMPADETPGRRSSVSRCEVTVRMKS
jgi:hypothetical protein